MRVKEARRELNPHRQKGCLKTRKKVTAIFILYKQRSNNNQLRDQRGCLWGGENVKG